MRLRWTIEVFYERSPRTRKKAGVPRVEGGAVWGGCCARGAREGRRLPVLLDCAKVDAANSAGTRTNRTIADFADIIGESGWAG